MKNNMQKIIQEFFNQKLKNTNDLTRVKRKIAKKYAIDIFKNSELLKGYNELVQKGKIKKSFELELLLRKRAIRTLSGIAPVAVLVEPFGCPADCAYCPTENKVPKSYLSNEPAVMRAIRCEYDPLAQVVTRLKALIANGHNPEKIELIVIGGTWSALPNKYKYWYILNCFFAANNYNDELRINNYKSTNKTKIQPWKKISLKKLKEDLQREQKKNEKAKYKIIGITLETRPDWIDQKELAQMRELGCTRVEIGVQLLDDKVLAKNKRGHGVAEVARATKMLKDWGFKITYHSMPGLPGSNPKNDLEKFKLFFKDERFQPDQIKFYPTVVIKGSLLYKWWQKGEYKPYSQKDLKNLIIESKKAVPRYVRIIRLIRDIPGESIEAGNTVTNLRQVMSRQGIKCQCIRCREPKQLLIANYELKIIKYRASLGEEYFISFESTDGKIIYGFCRLRLPSKDKQIFENTAFVRELHVYGELSPIGERKNIQHRRLGKKMMREAQKIAKQSGYKKIAVISGVGARDYYRKLGYRLNQTYMGKSL